MFCSRVFFTPLGGNETIQNVQKILKKKERKFYIHVQLCRFKGRKNV